MKQTVANPLVARIASLERRIDRAKKAKNDAHRHVYNCSNDLAALEHERQTALRQLRVEQAN
jgi:hypothetical protein